MRKASVIVALALREPKSFAPPRSGGRDDQAARAHDAATPESVIRMSSM